MTAITDLDALVNGMTGGNSGTPETIFFGRMPFADGTNAVATVGNRWTSLWKYAGRPAEGAAPTTPAIPDNATNGGLKQADPGGGRQKWLTSAWVQASVPGTLLLYDRLLHQGNLDGTVATAQNVQTATPSPALTRYTDGIGNIAFVEMYVGVGTTARTITMNYTNQSDASATSDAQVFGRTGYRENGRAIPLPLATGDYALKAVRTVTVSASTTGVGVWGITIAHPLATLQVTAAGGSAWRDFATGSPTLPEIQTDACLAMMWLPNNVTAPDIFGAVSMVEA